MELQQGKKRVGLIGTTFTIVGFVLGITIFVLPAELAPAAGPAVFLGFIFAGIPAFLSCFVAAQAANIFPTSGCGYIGASTVLSPFWGFLIVWNIMIAMVTGIPAVAYATADYVIYFDVFSEWNRMAIAAAVVLVFGLINLLGVKTTVALQAVMISIYMIILIVYGIGGFFNMDFALLDPLFPAELFRDEAGALKLTGLFEASVAATFTFGGFMVIAEMGDEIHDPKRTVPLALTFAFVMASLLYVGTAFVTPGLIPWQELENTPAPVAAAATTFMPAWAGTFIAVAALMGGTTSINAWFLTQSRDVYALARDRVLPKPLDHVNKHFEEPDGAVIFCVAITLVGVLLGKRVTDYALMTAFAVFIIYIIISMFILLAPRRVPEYFARAQFKLGSVGRWLVAGSFILISLVFLVIGYAAGPESARIYVILLVPGVIYYFIRKSWLRRQGIQIEDQLRKDVSFLLRDDRG